MHQCTILRRASLEGIGVHLGEPVAASFNPAPEGAGICFVRTDLPGCPGIRVGTDVARVATGASILVGQGFSISTVEHCLAAVAGLGIDNLVIELEGDELPIGDGSAKVFVDALREAGIAEQQAPRPRLIVARAIRHGDDAREAVLLPYDGLRITCRIEFSHPRIGTEELELDVDPETFVSEIAPARTFGFLANRERHAAMGVGLGCTLENTIVLDDEEIMNPEGLRYPDEFVRHKILDAIGDLAILGAPVVGHLRLLRPGHDLMHGLVQKVAASPECYRRE